jgi:hypothetical protein
MDLGSKPKRNKQAFDLAAVGETVHRSQIFCAMHALLFVVKEILFQVVSSKKFIYYAKSPTHPGRRWPSSVTANFV